MRIRRSTIVLVVAFVATLILYFEVRPPPQPGASGLFDRTSSTVQLGSA